MLQKVGIHNVKKGKRVVLYKQLPIGSGFGNRNPVQEGSWGDVTSEGFEATVLKVKFYSHYMGTENVQFNLLSAANFLHTDVY